MQSYAPQAGHALLVPSGPDKHLFFVLCDPRVIHVFGSAQRVILVNMSTIKGELYDPACVLEPGCHPFVKNDSFMAYRYAEVRTVTEIESNVLCGAWTRHGVDASSGLLKRILDGFCASRRADRDIKVALKCPNVLPRP